MNIFLSNISSNPVKLGKNVSKWRDFCNPYCNPNLCKRGRLLKNIFTYNTADDDGAAVEEGHLGL
jgi:hypothetical protein